MRLRRVQRKVCRRFGVVPAIPAAGTMIGIAPSRGRDLLPLNAVRYPPEGQSNGWYVWRGGEIPNDQDDFFVPSHVEHLGDHAPELIPYLALPPGWGVVLAKGHEDVWFDENLVSPRS
ncbi:hypothetical protein BCF44_101335 [Kutzneria buriramensis]|uniref:Imm33-like domain-containing protein n=1 Tax=Kutzneria buriramensis TaxID=1045776 RepID=A0A3E0IAZ4_9PSEU|nr:hypothetical protein BCF44_101335 [Kutzneria buriramensis]